MVRAWERNERKPVLLLSHACKIPPNFAKDVQIIAKNFSGSYYWMIGLKTEDVVVVAVKIS